MTTMIYNGLELSKLNDNEVLFFIRIRGKKSYFNNVYSKKFIAQFTSIKKHRCISEYKKDADVHIDITSIDRDFLYKNEFNQLTSIADINSMITRCRGLRSISNIEAKKLINRAFLFFDNFYNRNSKLKLIVMGTIDNYIMDMMVTVGRKYNIKFLAITDSFMSPEYKLCTVRGELNDINRCTNEEIVSFKLKILNTINNAKPPIKFNLFKKSIYYISSALYRYIVRYILFYKIFGRLEYEYRFTPYLNMLSSFDQLLSIRFLSYNPKFLDIKNKKAYIPLHFYPEATTDYWIDDIYSVDYLSSVLNTISRLKNLGYTVYAKEHPHYFLYRKSKFYQELIKYDCIIISPFTTTKEIFDNVDLVVVWNGSTGIESMIYGKDTVRVTNSYYGNNGSMSTLEDLESSKKFNYNLEECVEKVYRTSFRTY